MTVYVAFLRGINVGGRNIIKMKEVTKKLESLNLEGVTSFRASGNLLFSSKLGLEDVRAIIQLGVKELASNDIGVFLRTSSQMDEIMKLQPFKGREVPSAKLYVTFVPLTKTFSIPFPFKSKHEDVEVFLIENSNIFSQAYERKGRYGAPNNIIEKELNVLATTRNWNTIKGICEILENLS